MGLRAEAKLEHQQDLQEKNVGNAAMNTRVQISLQDPAFPSSGCGPSRAGAERRTMGLRVGEFVGCLRANVSLWLREAASDWGNGRLL